MSNFLVTLVLHLLLEHSAEIVLNSYFTLEGGNASAFAGYNTTQLAVLVHCEKEQVLWMVH